MTFLMLKPELFTGVTSGRNLTGGTNDPSSEMIEFLPQQIEPAT